MKSRKLSVLVPLAVAILAASAMDAAAQPPAPAVTASTNGPVVSVSWTAVSGATGYQISVTGSLTGAVNVPASTTSFVVSPPAGTYNLVVFTIVGSQLSSPSNTVSVTIGAGGGSPTPCAPPAATTVTASAQGLVASISWTPVAGTVGYRVEFSRTPGGTELVQTLPASQTSLQGVAPFAGTFYVRVVTGNTCGTTPSAEVSFTAGTVTPPGTPPPAGQGNRTPDPIAGQPGVIIHRGDPLLPIPSYAPSVVAALGAQFPGEAALARPSECAGGNNNFLYRVVRELRKRDTRWGLNYKRGNFGSPSQDIITYNGSARPDNAESHVWVIDIVGGDCGRGVATFSDKSMSGTWDQEGQPYCGTRFCAYWNLDGYLAAGNPLYPQ
jgi:hypothetical protein